MGDTRQARVGDAQPEASEPGENAEGEQNHRQSDPDREPVFRQPACALFHRPSLFVATSGRIIKQTALLRYAGQCTRLTTTAKYFKLHLFRFKQCQPSPAPTAKRSRAPTITARCASGCGS